MFVRNRENTPLVYRRRDYRLELKPNTVTYVDDSKVSADELKKFYGSRIDIVGEEVAPEVKKPIIVETTMMKEEVKKPVKKDAVVDKKALNDNLLESIMAEVVSENPKKFDPITTVPVNDVQLDPFVGDIPEVPIVEPPQPVEVVTTTPATTSQPVEVVTNTEEFTAVPVTHIGETVTDPVEVVTNTEEFTPVVPTPAPTPQPVEDEVKPKTRKGTRKGTGKGRSRKPKKV